jgi:hypothetical protein
MKNKRLSTSCTAKETLKISNIRQIMCQCGDGSEIEPLKAVEIKVFRCLIEKIRLVSNNQRKDRNMPVTMEVSEKSGKTSILWNT